MHLLLECGNESLSTHMVIIAAGHFEMCISTLNRVTTYLENIKAHPKVAQPLKDSLPRSLSILNGHSQKQITDMRHAIEHLENRIQRGEIASGQSLCIFPIADGLELGRHKITFSDLALWISEAHECSKIIAEYRET